MIQLDGFNLRNNPRVTHVTMNASYVSAKVDGKAVDIRHVSKQDWYDEKHRRVVKATDELEKALEDILPK